MNNVPVKTVVLYSNSHIGSILVLNNILKMKCYEVTAIVRVNNVELSNKGLRKVKKHINKTGYTFAFMLFFQHIIQALAFGLSFMLPFLKKRTKTSSELAKKYGFEIHDATNINSPKTLAFLKSHSPEIIISAYFPQILKKKALSIPSKGILNLHPGYLPAYKGAMAYFWAAKNNAGQAGVSIHWMDEGIDTGPLLARKLFRINRKTSQDKVLIITALIGSSLLKRIGRKLMKGKEPKTIDTGDEVKKYYPLPGRKAFKEYYQVRCFISFGIIFRAIMGKY
ncbi:MAG: hypothetical protein NE328_08380 [Lentisphaeraceae bacterium]|nr:hypothetical protein [Lentisphaeraceae bacterium]